jgi:beta-1,4-N-acetylglucosaminyltransferase
MLALLDHVDKRFYTPRVYVSAATDALSATKAAARERRWADADDADDQRPRQPPQRPYELLTIPRSREVGQPWISSAFSTARACLSASLLIPREKPALLLANGPGTCVPLCAAAVAWRALGVCQTRVAYVESVARVRRLSLSAKLLRVLRLADVLMVQWPALAEKKNGGGGGGGAGRAECVGRLF